MISYCEYTVYKEKKSMICICDLELGEWEQKI